MQARCSILYSGEPLYDVYHAYNLSADLHIDQIVDTITAEKDFFELKTIYGQKPRIPADVLFRMDVAKALERQPLRDGITAFAQSMFRVRRFLSFSAETGQPQQKDKWLLDAAKAYMDALAALEHALALNDAHSEGLMRFHAWLAAYRASDAFTVFCTDTAALHSAFDAMRHGITIDMTAESVTIHDDDGEGDFCAGLLSVFGPLLNDDFGDEVSGFTDINLSFFELKVLEILMKRRKDDFKRLAEYGRRYPSFIDEAVRAFDRETQFYMTYLDYMDGLKRKGFRFCWPEYADAPVVRIEGAYDMSLAQQEGRAARGVVVNDFCKEGYERVFILTGPNQGGKTTFARTLGQALYFASLGLPVPCDRAVVYHFGGLHTHFAVEEDLASGYGRLKEELTRLRALLDKLAEGDIVIFNELFATTTTYDALHMGRQLLGMLENRASVCLYITHIYELASLNERTVSLVAEVDGERPTFRILRAPTDARAYADALLEQHKLSYSAIMERMP